MTIGGNSAKVAESACVQTYKGNLIGVPPWQKMVCRKQGFKCDRYASSVRGAKGSSPCSKAARAPSITGRALDLVAQTTNMRSAFDNPFLSKHP
jgi:hypothetical protein